MAISEGPRPLLLLKDSMNSPIQLQSKEDTAKDFRSWLAQATAEDIIIYSDGSQSEGGAVGWGYAIFAGNPLRLSGHGRLAQAEVFDAEIFGALSGLQIAAQRFPLSENASYKYTVCIDSTSAIQSLQGIPSDSSQAEALAFQSLAQATCSAIRWCPGHMGIMGNELADVQAKLGTSLPISTSSPLLSLLSVELLGRARKTASPAGGRLLPPGVQRPSAAGDLKELLLPRPTLHHLIAARTGHGDFADYHTISPR